MSPEEPPADAAQHARRLGGRLGATQRTELPTQKTEAVSERDRFAQCRHAQAQRRAHSDGTEPGAPTAT